jgi:mono/diheme cytochrome c family protein
MFMRSLAHRYALITSAILLPAALLLAADADTKFHNAPPSAQAAKNPYQGQDAAVLAGKHLYAKNCLACHGKLGKGTGNVPSLVDGKLDSVKSGEVFWFISRGDKDNGMPAWAPVLSATERWQVVTYVKSMAAPPTALAASSPAPADMNTSTMKAAPPTPPFTDFRYEKPGTVHKIMASDLPQPYATPSSDNGPELVARPENVWPTTLPGFKVELFAAGLDNPRTLRTAPNGDIFLTESGP